MISYTSATSRNSAMQFFKRQFMKDGSGPYMRLAKLESDGVHLDFFAANENGDIVGVAVTDADSLVWLEVIPERRKKGIATKLIDVVVGKFHHEKRNFVSFSCDQPGAFGLFEALPHKPIIRLVGEGLMEGYFQINKEYRKPTAGKIASYVVTFKRSGKQIRSYNGKERATVSDLLDVSFPEMLFGYHYKIADHVTIEIDGVLEFDASIASAEYRDLGGKFDNFGIPYIDQIDLYTWKHLRDGRNAIA